MVNIERNFQSFSEIIARIIDPILRERIGFSIQILENWAEIAGYDIAETTQPLEIVWSPPRWHGMGKAFEPAVLIVACDSFSAMKLLHKSSEVIQRLNAYFGYSAIARLKIKQRPIRAIKKVSSPQKDFIDDKQQTRLKQMLVDIRNDTLRQALFKLGVSILTSKVRE